MFPSYIQNCICYTQQILNLWCGTIQLTYMYVRIDSYNDSSGFHLTTYLTVSTVHSRTVWTNHKIKGTQIKTEMHNLVSYVYGAIKSFNCICYLIKHQLVSRMAWVGSNIKDNWYPHTLPWAGLPLTRSGCPELHPTWPQTHPEMGTDSSSG